MTNFKISRRELEMLAAQLLDHAYDFEFSMAYDGGDKRVFEEMYLVFGRVRDIEQVLGKRALNESSDCKEVKAKWKQRFTELKAAEQLWKRFEAVDGGRPRK